MKNLKIGLEIHIQLNTGKLFCSCPCESEEAEIRSIHRTLYPTSGELGKTDRAALFELSRGRRFEYAVSSNSCLVELDEEPPHDMNAEAVRVALEMCTSLNCRLFPEIFVMRKIVVDGSNTGGFQRTSLVGIEGNLDVNGHNIGIPAICLEEDSARKISQNGDKVNYSLDRLGVPLVEISTDPDIRTPEEAVEVAREIGYMVASTGKMKQGAESIRQDVNMSLGYGRVEIKGVSSLSLIKEVIEAEIKRQQGIAESIKILKERGIPDFGQISPTDVTDVFMKTESRLISSALKKGERIFAVVLENLNGLLKNEGFRLGKEIADSLKPFGIKGILHGDELPGYGIEESAVMDIKGLLDLKDNDSFAIIAAVSGREKDLVSTISERLKKIVSLDLSETRFANQDGTTAFLRPLPGRERMYPETDIPTFMVSSELLEQISRTAPKTFEGQVTEVAEKYKISKQDSSTIIRNGDRHYFEEFSEFVEPKYAARILIHVLPQIEKDLDTVIEKDNLKEILKKLSEKGWEKVSLEPFLRIQYSEKMKISEIFSDPRVVPLSTKEIKKLISDIKKSGNPITKKNVISELRRNTDRPFDPVNVISNFDV